MTTVHNWPAGRHFQPSTMSWRARTPRSAWAAFYTGQQQSISHLGTRLAVSLTLPPCSSADAGEREAFFQRLASQGEWVYLPHMQRPVPRGAFGGTPVVASNAAAGATSISLSGVLSRPNILLNNAFENDGDVDGLGDGWAAYNSALATGIAYSRVSNSPFGYAQRIACTALNGDTIGIICSPTQAVQGGQTYTLSADFIANYTSLTCTLYIGWYDAGASPVGSPVSVSFAGPTTWEKKALNATAPATATQCYVYAWFSGGAEASPQIYVDNFNMEPGTVTPRWVGRPTLASGDVLGVNGQLVQCAYGGCYGYDGGTITVPLVLPLRKAITAGQAVTWNQPTGTFQLAGGEFVADYSAGRMQEGVTLEFLEAFA